MASLEQPAAGIPEQRTGSELEHVDQTGHAEVVAANALASIEKSSTEVLHKYGLLDVAQAKEFVRKNPEHPEAVNILLAVTEILEAEIAEKDATIEYQGLDKTGVYNETGLDTKLRSRFGISHKEVTYLSPQSREQLLEQEVLIILFDVCDLKLINDTYGHPDGDAMLTNAAHIIAELAREDDIVARIGGDEFVLVAKIPPGMSDAEKRAFVEQFETRFKEALTKKREIPTQPVVALGVATGTVAEYHQALFNADQEMYRHKKFLKKKELITGRKLEEEYHEELETGWRKRLDEVYGWYEQYKNSLDNDEPPIIKKGPGGSIDALA